MLLTEFPFLKSGSFEMRKKNQMSSFWKRLKNGLEQRISALISVGWKESWRLDEGFRLCPTPQFPLM